MLFAVAAKAARNDPAAPGEIAIGIKEIVITNYQLAFVTKPVALGDHPIASATEQVTNARTSITAGACALSIRCTCKRVAQCATSEPFGRAPEFSGN